MKTLTAATLAALIAAGATYAIAQQGPGSGGPSGWEARRAERMERFMRDDLPAITDSRIAGLKGGLKLTPEQEKLWPPVEQALREMASQRAQMMQQRHARRGAGPVDPMERLDHMVENSARMNANLTKLRDAAKPLYATLDERQKRVLPTLIRQGRHHMAGGWGGHGWGGRGEHRGMMDGMGERGWMGRGYGPQGGPNWGDGQPQRQ